MDGYVYLATDGELYKIGRTADISSRVIGLRTEAKSEGRNPNINIIHSFPCVNASFCERYLHKTFAEQRKYGEWFNLDLEQVESIKCLAVGDETTFPFEDADASGLSVNASIRLPLSLKLRLERYISSINRGVRRVLSTSEVSARIIGDFLDRQDSASSPRDADEMPEVAINSRWKTWNPIIKNWNYDWFCVVALYSNWAICQVRNAKPFLIHKRDFADETKYKLFDPQQHLREDYIAKRLAEEQ